MRQGNNFKRQADAWLPSPIARRLDCIYGIWKVKEWSGNTRAGVSALYHIHKNWVQETIHSEYCRQEENFNTWNLTNFAYQNSCEVGVLHILSHLIWRLSLGGRHCYSHFHVKKPSLKVWENAHFQHEMGFELCLFLEVAALLCSSHSSTSWEKK